MKNRHKYFRWTPRTAWITFAYIVAVPAAFGYVGFMTDVSRTAAMIVGGCGLVGKGWFELEVVQWELTEAAGKIRYEGEEEGRHHL